MGTWNINEKNTFSLVITALKVMCTDEKEWNCALSWLIKIISEWIQIISVRIKSKILKENIGEMSWYWFDNFFLNSIKGKSNTGQRKTCQKIHFCWINFLELEGVKQVTNGEN